MTSELTTESQFEYQNDPASRSLQTRNNVSIHFDATPSIYALMNELDGIIESNSSLFNIASREEGYLFFSLDDLLCKVLALIRSRLDISRA